MLWSEIPDLAQADNHATHAKRILYDIVVWDATGYARDTHIVCVEYDVPGVVRVPSNSRWYRRSFGSDRVVAWLAIRPCPLRFVKVV